MTHGRRDDPGGDEPSGGAGENRIAMVLGTSTGGVGVHVESLVAHLVRDGWPVTVCAPRSTLELFDFAGARPRVVPIRSAGLEVLAVPALRSALRGVRLVHAHGLRAGTTAVLVHRRPLVVTWHNAVLAHGMRAAVLAAGERLVARRADVNLAASADLARRVRALGGRSVALAPVAAPAPVVRRSASQVRDDLGLDPSSGAPLVVAVGRLHPQKAHDVLIRAARQWATLAVPPLVVIAGDGPEHDRLRALITATGAPVRLLGRRADVPDLLAAADVVVLASRWEARPLVVQEAMSLGTAVVATDVGGIGELVGDGAVLVPPDDVQALSRAVIDLLAARGQRTELGRRAVARAATWPGEQDTARACAEVYRGLLG